MLTTVGAPVIAAILAGDRGWRLGIGVGAGSAAPGADDMQLGGDGDEFSAWHLPLDPTFPAAEGPRLVCQATFHAGTAQFAWNEYGLIAARSEITPHHTLAGVGETPLLLTRHVPAHALMRHHEDVFVPGMSTKPADKHWVLRIHLLPG